MYFFYIWQADDSTPPVFVALRELDNTTVQNKYIPTYRRKKTDNHCVHLAETDYF